MPYPTSLEMAQSVERIVRSTGSIPATIAVIGGRIKIGLHPAELERLADQRSNPTAVKLSRRDIAAAIALKKDGGTTSCSTLIFAALAGIKVRMEQMFLHAGLTVDLGLCHWRVCWGMLTSNSCILRRYS
jgi:pseudouridine-5'-phosphate glycosidase/pseudouridine kinase